jgi:hypothetical protein
MTASLQLVRNSRAASSGAKPALVAMSMCTGNAAARHTHQIRTGNSSKAAVRTALGGHNSEVVDGANVRRKPICAPV